LDSSKTVHALHLHSHQESCYPGFTRATILLTAGTTQLHHCSCCVWASCHHAPTAATSIGCCTTASCLGISHSHLNLHSRLNAANDRDSSKNAHVISEVWQYLGLSYGQTLHFAASDGWACQLVATADIRHISSHMTENEAPVVCVESPVLFDSTTSRADNLLVRRVTCVPHTRPHLMEVICFTTSAGECRSMRRLWILQGGGTHKSELPGTATSCGLP
jgi:hypothetical protein